MTKAELHAELEKGYQDCVEGKVQPVDEAFAEIRKEYGIYVVK
jgi:hypothetical protein